MALSHRRLPGQVTQHVDCSFPFCLAVSPPSIWLNAWCNLEILGDQPSGKSCWCCCCSWERLTFCWPGLWRRFSLLHSPRQYWIFWLVDLGEMLFFCYEESNSLEPLWRDNLLLLYHPYDLQHLHYLEAHVFIFYKPSSPSCIPQNSLWLQKYSICHSIVFIIIFKHCSLNKNSWQLWPQLFSKVKYLLKNPSSD